MPSPLGAIGSLGAIGTAASGAPTAAAEATVGFGDQLTQMIQHVEDTSADANTAVGDMLSKTGEVHDAMIALQRAEMSLQFTVAVRNKLVQAYNDIMRMPI